MVKAIVRQAEIEDLDSILSIEQESFTTPWPEDSMRKELVDNKLALYVVIEVEEEVIGYAGIWIILNEGHITNIAVKKDFRGYGYGKLLLRGLLYFCDEKEVEMITLEVRKSNIVAQNLYKRYGFIEEGIRNQYYRDNLEDAIIMNRYRESKEV